MDNSNTFTFTAKHKKTFAVMIVIGLIGLLFGILNGDVSGGRVWANVLLNNVLFLGIAFLAVAFIATHYSAFSGWHVLVKKIPEAISSFLPVGFALMAIVVVGLWTHSHHLFHWAEEGLTTEGAPTYYEIAEHKSAYLNLPIFTIRFVVYGLLWIGIARILRKYSLMEDKLGGIKPHKRSKKWSSIFLVVFGVTSSTFAWDFLMSIDFHWYSTCLLYTSDAADE